MKLRNLFILVISIIVCQMAGVIGAIFTASSIPTWYSTLSKPFFAPPNWVFAPVWITLYFLMGISLYLVLSGSWGNENISKETRKISAKKGISFFAIQLILNTIWSIIFFGFKNPGLAFIEIIILWVFIALTIIQFWNISRKSAYFLIPYIVWVTIAAALNFGIWFLN